MKPETPLPWRWAYGSIWTGENVSPTSDAWTDPQEAGEIRIANMDRDEPCTYGAERDRNGRYLAHAANMYPRLVEAVDKLVLSAGVWPYLNPAIMDKQSFTELETALRSAVTLLAECEEE